MKTKPRGITDNNHQLEVVYQEEEMCDVNQIVNNVQVDPLHDVAVGFK